MLLQLPRTKIFVEVNVIYLYVLRILSYIPFFYHSMCIVLFMFCVHSSFSLFLHFVMCVIVIGINECLYGSVICIGMYLQKVTFVAAACNPLLRSCGQWLLPLFPTSDTKLPNIIPNILHH